MKWNVKEIKELIKDLDDDVEVVVESVILGEEKFCSNAENIYSSIDGETGDKLLVVVPKNISINNI